jgi:hypothetical protein
MVGARGYDCAVLADYSSIINILHRLQYIITITKYSWTYGIREFGVKFMNLADWPIEPHRAVDKILIPSTPLWHGPCRSTVFALESLAMGAGSTSVGLSVGLSPFLSPSGFSGLRLGKRITELGEKNKLYSPQNLCKNSVSILYLKRALSPTF